MYGAKLHDFYINKLVSKNNKYYIKLFWRMTTERGDQNHNEETNEIFSPFSIINEFEAKKLIEFPAEIELEANEQILGKNSLN